MLFEFLYFGFLDPPSGNTPARATYITITVRLVAGNKKTLIRPIKMIFRCLSNREHKGQLVELVKMYNLIINPESVVQQFGDKMENIPYLSSVGGRY